MYRINNENYYNDIYNSDTKRKLKIFVDGIELDTKYLKSLTYKDECFTDKNFTLGNATIGCVELELDKQALNNFDNYNQFYFEEIVTIDNELIRIPIGFFYAHDDLIDTKDKFTIKLTLYDKMYDISKLTINFKEEIEEGNFTRLNLAQLICENVGIVLETNEFINCDCLIGSYDNTLSCQSWLSFISERAGGFAKIGRDGKLYIKSFGDVDNVNISTKTKGETTSGEVKTITGVVFQNAKDIYSVGDDSGLVVYLSQDNYFSCTQEEVNRIYESLSGLQFQTLKIQIWGDTSIDTGDIIQIGEYKTFCQKDWTWGRGFYGYYDTTVNEVKSSLDISKISNSQQSRHLRSIIDETNGTIETLIDVTDNNTNKISRVIQDLNNVQNLFQITGGVNLIKNSVGLFNDNYWEKSENGIFEFGEDIDLIGRTVSKSRISISDGTLITTNDNITGLTYSERKTINFKIKQDANVTTTIKIYGLDENNPLYQKTFNEEISEYIEVFDNQNPEENQFYIDNPNLRLKIESNSLFGGKVYISDLMLNNGDKTEWQPAASEIWGTIVKLSQIGVSVYSVNGNFATVMDATGFSVRELHGENLGNIITDFNISGINTKDIEQSGKHIQKKLVHDVIQSNGYDVYVEYIKEN